VKHLVLIVSLLASPAFSQATEFESWHEHHDRATPIWVLPKIHAPENMQWTVPGMPGEIASGRFYEPENCSGCHGEIYNQWKGSMMANAWKDPVFIAVYKNYISKASSKAEKEEVAMCSRCHTPSGYMADSPGRYFEGELTPVDQAGVSCDVCHSVAASAGVGNGSFILQPGDASKNEYGVKYGPRRDSRSPTHGTAYSELHTRSELCGMCHDVGHAHNIMPIESTYSEWRTGPYNTGDPETSTHCQDCHMRQNPEHAATGSTTLPDTPGFAAPEFLGAKQREHVWQHYFIGGNFVVTALLGNEQAAKMAQHRLEHALTVEVLAPKDGLNRQSLGTLRVKVTNSGAGHYLPTGLTYVREMWIHLKVTDAKGEVLHESGYLDEAGAIEPNAAVFKTVLGEGGEERKPTFFLPAAAQVLHDYRIRPKGYTVDDFPFYIPEGVAGPLSVTAEVNYRSAPQFLANELLGPDAPVLPVFVMGSVTSTIELANP